jgi:RNA polymerase sigma factor (sigma-70 family)
MPPPAEGFAARLVLGPALRTQPDRRLVALVRDGYETAFDEIVRRYGGPLRRYAAAIVGVRSEEVTQDAFSKALLALRQGDAEIELRPWLYRIVRNTALNDLRDRPPAAEALAETLAGGRNPAEELERREELADLIRQLRTLPESQRAAIMMRELEGLSHEEIAAALGVSGGAARQAIHRARTALRNGLGMLLPMPVLRALLAGSSSPSIEAAAGAGGAGVVLKATTATVLVAGVIGAGAAIDHGRRHEEPATAGVARLHSGDRLRTVTTRNRNHRTRAPSLSPRRTPARKAQAAGAAPGRSWTRLSKATDTKDAAEARSLPPHRETRCTAAVARQDRVRGAMAAATARPARMVVKARTARRTGRQAPAKNPMATGAKVATQGPATDRSPPPATTPPRATVRNRTAVQIQATEGQHSRRAPMTCVILTAPACSPSRNHNLKEDR